MYGKAKKWPLTRPSVNVTKIQAKGNGFLRKIFSFFNKKGFLCRAFASPGTWKNNQAAILVVSERFLCLVRSECRKSVPAKSF